MFITVFPVSMTGQLHLTRALSYLVICKEFFSVSIGHMAHDLCFKIFYVNI